MNSQISRTLISGIAGTLIMTMVMFVAPYMGLPKMNPATMLSGMMGVPSVVGWIMHFMIGIIFASVFVYLFSSKVKIANIVVKGALFGIAVFIFAQIMMAVMGAIMGGMPKSEGTMIAMMTGSTIGHIVFGIVVALVAKALKK